MSETKTLKAPPIPAKPKLVACSKSPDGKHEWSQHSTFPFCIWCAKEKS